jgi:membrane protein DedA with SNARE-associated domain
MTTFFLKPHRIIFRFLMIEYAIEFVKQLPPVGILAFVCFITFLENIFPPAPSDTILVFCGTFVGLGIVGFVPMLLSASAGSTAGFLVMYWVGQRYGTRLIDSPRVSFIPKDAIEKVEAWFKRYGFWIIVANRFMSGTRAVISAFAGISGLPLGTTTLLSAVSAGLWNAILLSAGAALGKNWTLMNEYLQLYGNIFAAIAVVALLVWIGVQMWRSARKNG